MIIIERNTVNTPWNTLENALDARPINDIGIDAINEYGFDDIVFTEYLSFCHLVQFSFFFHFLQIHKIDRLDIGGIAYSEVQHN